MARGGLETWRFGVEGFLQFNFRLGVMIVLGACRFVGPVIPTLTHLAAGVVVRFSSGATCAGRL